MAVGILYDDPIKTYNDSGTWYWDAITAALSAVGNKYNIELNGVGYRLWVTPDGALRYRKYDQPTFVPKQDTSETRGAHSFEYWWPKDFEDWKLGAGQKKYGTLNKFYSSVGIDISESNEITLLKDTAVSKAIASSYLPLVECGGNLYTASATANQAHYTPQGITWFDVSLNEAGASLYDLTTDGEYVYGCLSAGGVHRGTTSTWAHWSDQTGVTKLCYDNKKIYGLAANVFYELAAAAGSTAKYTGDAGWTLNAICGSPDKVYFSGYSGSRSCVWAYDVTSVTRFWLPPVGFIVTSLTYELTTLFVGGYDTVSETGGGIGKIYAITSSGFPVLIAKVGIAEASKNYAVKTSFMVGTDLYFGNSYGSGLYRYSFSGGGYSFNIYNAAVGEVISGIYFKNKKYFGISGSGIYGESANYLTTGYLISSEFDWNMPDDKLWNQISLYHKALVASQSVVVTYSLDGTTWATGGTSDTVGATTKDISLSGVTNPSLWHKATLNGTTSATPTLKMVRLQAVPVDYLGEMWRVPIVCSDYPELLDGSRDTRTGRQIADSLWDAKNQGIPVAFRDIDYLDTTTEYTVKIDNIDEQAVLIEHPDKIETVAIVTLRRVS